MLQGTFETLSLPEVLGLLASARKSGALWLEAGPITGVVHLEDGHCHATVAGDLAGPVESGPELLTRLVDLCFECMCQESGSFRFAAEDPAPWWSPEPVELSDAMVEVDRLLKQWREILTVIPSLECRPQLLDALEVDELVVDRERWALLVAIDGRRTVRELVARSNRRVIDVCHVLLEWVEAGAIGVIDPTAGRAPETEGIEVEAPEVEAPESEAFETGAFESGAFDEEPADPPDAGEPSVVEAVFGDGEEAEPVPYAVEPAAESQPEPPQAEPQSEPAPEQLEPVMQGAPAAVNGARADYVESAPMASVAQGESPGSEPADKGAFLRLFSGLRES